MSTEKKFTIAPTFIQQLKNPDDYTFCGVRDEDDETNFLYTINATQKLGAELIIVGGLGIDPMFAFLTSFIELIKNSLIVEGLYSTNAIKVPMENGPQPIRIFAKDVTGEAWLDDKILNRCDNFNKVYQIYFGDRLNELPTDSGNLDSFKQVQKVFLDPIPESITIS